MVNGAIHRVIEQQAAMQPEAIALVDGADSITYRELNQRANTLARRLAECGLKRGALAHVRMDRCADLATVLLAVLKAGAAYAWVSPESRRGVELPASFCIARRTTVTEESYLALDIQNALAACALRPGPNLPILTRGSDIACVLPDDEGRPTVLVPHETITSMPSPARRDGWVWDPGAFALWLGLMSGDTVTVYREPQQAQPSELPSATQAA